MNARLRTLLLLLATVATLFTLAAGPVMATESAPAGEESGKVSLPQTSHDRVGLIILGVGAVFVVGALANAAKQLKGSRPQADGRIRWR
jgi:hypothetical protein